MALIVVPIYNAAAALRQCLAALDAHCPADQDILLIDDASTDPEINDLVAEFAHRPGVRLVRHTENQGFVRSANEGFEATDGDVILLNSDAVVTEGWLDALLRCANSDPAIATVTPWSNNAEICSIPGLCQAEPVPADPDGLARAIRAVGPAVYPELPTAVGFCMLVRRAALQAVGPFDEATFGRGYGEENDFCRRAAAVGLRNVLCDDAYVVHLGGASFAAEGLTPGGDAMARLLQKHPDYEQVIHEFIQNDPLAPRRTAIVEAVGADRFDGAPDSLEFTGERFHPECEREIWYEHYHRYAFARSLASGLEVLDLACGEGYGSAILAQVAARVVGIDAAESAIDHARRRYRQLNLELRVGDATAVPLPDDSMDLVVSFETLEHLEPQEAMLDEFVRVLRDDGLLLISSPDKRTYSDERDYHNEFHVRELYRDQFEALLRERFPHVRLLGQKLAFQSLIWDPQQPVGRYIRQELDARTGALTDWRLEPLYWIGVCALNEAAMARVNTSDLWLFGDRSESVYDHYYHEIRKNMQAGQLLMERDEEIARLRRRVEELERRPKRWWARLKDRS